MRRPLPSLIALVSALAAAGTGLLTQPAQAQTLYKSVGPDGAVAYTDQRPAPGSAARTVVLEPPALSIVPGVRPETPTAAQRPAVAPPPGDTVLYMARWCGNCRSAKAYMDQRRIAYREIDIDTPTGKTAFQQLGARGIPVLLTQGQRVAGFSSRTYDAAFAPRAAR